MAKNFTYLVKWYYLLERAMQDKLAWESYQKVFDNKNRISKVAKKFKTELEI